MCSDMRLESAAGRTNVTVIQLKEVVLSCLTIELNPHARKSQSKMARSTCLTRGNSAVPSTTAALSFSLLGLAIQFSCVSSDYASALLHYASTVIHSGDTPHLWSLAPLGKLFLVFGSQMKAI